MYKRENGSGMAGLLVVLVILALLIVFGISSYNKIVTAQENVESSLADVDTQLQRRADLIPNLVSTVSGYMEHENSIIQMITESREALLSAHTIGEKSEAADALTEAIQGLMVIVENYPDLKADKNFIHLQDELAGTENRIATARRDYNSAVKNYNQIIKRVPGVFFARMFGFDPAEYFEAKEGSDEVPHVSF